MDSQGRTPSQARDAANQKVAAARRKTQKEEAERAATRRRLEDDERWRRDQQMMMETEASINRNNKKLDETEDHRIYFDFFFGIDCMLSREDANDYARRLVKGRRIDFHRFKETYRTKKQYYGVQTAINNTCAEFGV